MVVIFLFLISLIGCIAPSIIDKGLPPGTPKGFVEFYTFSGHYYPRKSTVWPCYELQKARPEYISVHHKFAVSIDLKYPPQALNKAWRPEDFSLKLDLPSYWLRIALSPGEHKFVVFGGENPVLFPLYNSSEFIVTAKEGMITLNRIEAECFKSSSGTKGSLSIVRSAQIPITSDEKSRPLFKQLLNNPDWTVRFYAARIIGGIGDPNTVDLLIDALRDDVWEVRMQASFSLAKFKNVSNRRIIDLITKALIEDSTMENLDQMRNTAMILGEIGDERAIAPLEKCLKEKYDPLYWQSEVQMAKRDCSDALKKVRQRLNK